MSQDTANPVLAAIAGLLLVVLFASTSWGGVQPAQAQQENYDTRFSVSTWAELNMLMDADATIEWSVASSGGESFYFDLHSHDDGGRVAYHEQFHSTTGQSGTFTAPADDGYSFLVENVQEDPVTVRLQVSGPFEVESTPNIEPLAGDSNGSPGPGVLLFLLVMVAAARATTGARMRG